MTAASQWRWDEVADPPKGLDVAGLGQVPHLHEGRYYVKHPGDGRVLGAVNVNTMVNIPLDLAATLSRLQTDIAALGPGAIPAAILSDVAAVASAAALQQASIVNLKNELDAAKTALAAARAQAGAVATTTPPAATGWTNGKVAAVGAGGAAGGGALGFLAGYFTGKARHAAAIQAPLAATHR